MAYSSKQMKQMQRIAKELMQRGKKHTRKIDYRPSQIGSGQAGADSINLFSEQGVKVNEFVNDSKEIRGSLYSSQKEDPAWPDRWKDENIREYKEAIYDRISNLLLGQFSVLEEHLALDNGILSLQKTYKDGQLVTGKKESDMQVIYESDIDANADSKDMEDSLLKWLEFAHPNKLELEIKPIVTTNEGTKMELTLVVGGEKRLNINDMIGVLGLDSINIKDNVSQFMGVDSVKTDLNRKKLMEYTDTNFSELKPVTFTHLLERYDKLKKQLPFYRYRTDDFFKEYGSVTNIPTWYRVEKFFEEFDRILNLIPRGSIAEPDSVQGITNEQLFGWGTMSYLISEAQRRIGVSGAVWSHTDVRGWREQLDSLNVSNATMQQEIQNKNLEITQLNNALDAVNNPETVESSQGDFDYALAGHSHTVSPGSHTHSQFATLESNIKSTADTAATNISNLDFDDKLAAARLEDLATLRAEIAETNKSVGDHTHSDFARDDLLKATRQSVQSNYETIEELRAAANKIIQHSHPEYENIGGGTQYDPLDANQDGGINVLDIQKWVDEGRTDMANQVLARLGMPPIPEADPLDYNRDGTLNVLDMVGWTNEGDQGKAQQVLTKIGFQKGGLVPGAKQTGVYINPEITEFGIVGECRCADTTIRMNDTCVGWSPGLPPTELNPERGYPCEFISVDTWGYNAPQVCGHYENCYWDNTTKFPTTESSTVQMKKGGRTKPKPTRKRVVRRK